MTKLDEINKLIAELSEEERNGVSDWYHTFGELYEHRCALYVAFVNSCKELEDLCIQYNVPADYYVFKKSKLHFDWTSRDWWFILQWYIYWEQISYHLPMKYREVTKAFEQEKADERDWHTSQDVLDRLLLV